VNYLRSRSIAVIVLAFCCTDEDTIGESALIEMSELRQRGFVVTDGPFSFNEISNFARDYDHSFAVTPDARIKRGRTSTRWGGFVSSGPFYRIYLHQPLLSAALELIGGPMKLSSFFARTLLPNIAADPPHQDVAPGADGYPLVGFILMVDEFRVENGATRFIAGSQNGPRCRQPMPSHATPAAGQARCLYSTAPRGHVAWTRRKPH
jgi:hypothetical protein